MAERIRLDVLGLNRAEARMTARLMAPGAEQYAKDNGGLPPAVAALIGELERFGAEPVAEPVDAQVSGTPRTTGSETIEIVTSSAPVGASTAALRLGVSPKAVRDMCLRKVLKGRQDARGEWRIDPGSVEAEADRRRERTAHGQGTIRVAERAGDALRG